MNPVFRKCSRFPFCNLFFPARRILHFHFKTYLLVFKFFERLLLFESIFRKVLICEEAIFYKFQKEHVNLKLISRISCLQEFKPLIRSTLCEVKELLEICPDDNLKKFNCLLVNQLNCLKMDNLLGPDLQFQRDFIDEIRVNFEKLLFELEQALEVILKSSIPIDCDKYIKLVSDILLELCLEQKFLYPRSSVIADHYSSVESILIPLEMEINSERLIYSMNLSSLLAHMQTFLDWAFNVEDENRHMFSGRSYRGVRGVFSLAKLFDKFCDLRIARDLLVAFNEMLRSLCSFPVFIFLIFSSVISAIFLYKGLFLAFLVLNSFFVFKLVSLIYSWMSINSILNELANIDSRDECLIDLLQRSRSERRFSEDHYW